VRRALAALAFLATMPGVALAQDASMRLEMLAERIARLHAQTGQGVLPDRSRKALTGAVGDFDAGLKEVRSRATGAEVRDNYILLGLLWTEYRTWALKPATRDNAKKLAERAEEVAWVAAKGARLLHDSGRKGTGRLALDAAHAAMLSQRLGRLYLTQSWGVKEESAARDIPAVTGELHKVIGRLRGAAQNTPEIETELQAAEGQLGFLLQNGRELASRRPSPTAPEFIAKSADHFLESMERVVRLYEGGQ
jgi:hypothetical protein